MITLTTSGVRRAEAVRRRDGLAEEGLCINGGGHGEATHGVLCLACREVHRGHALESTFGAEKYAAWRKESVSGGRTILQIAKEMGCLVARRRSA